MTQLSWKYTAPLRRILSCYVLLVSLSCVGDTKDVSSSRKKAPVILIKDIVSSGLGAVYFDLLTGNYTHLIELPALKSIYVV
ncbi:hypothetical protein CLF_112636, partial [Clonorchis sinensis]